MWGLCEVGCDGAAALADVLVRLGHLGELGQLRLLGYCSGA
jgi:hypothetical protein